MPTSTRSDSLSGEWPQFNLRAITNTIANHRCRAARDGCQAWTACRHSSGARHRRHNCIIRRTVNGGVLCASGSEKPNAQIVLHRHRRPGLDGAGFGRYAHMAGQETVVGHRRLLRGPATSGRNSNDFTGRHPLHIRFHRPTSRCGLKPRGSGYFRTMGCRSCWLAG